MIARLVCLIALLQITSAQPVPATGSIEGFVVQLGTREPLEDVRVDLVIEQGGSPTDIRRASLSSPTRSDSPTTRSDEQGRFVFKDVAAGNYRLLFSADGFVRQEYGQRAFKNKGALLRLAADQTMKDLVAELTPAGVVSGAIVDNDRQPLEGVTVQLMRAGYTSSGRRLFPVGGAVKSDDRGQYRIFFVAPGRYYVHAGTPLKGAGIDLSTAFNSFPETYSAVYFPGAANLQFATPVDVLPGTALSGVDFTLSKARGVRVRGSVVDATTGMPPENNPSIWLSLRDPAGEDYTLDLTGRGKVSYSRNGTFEFRDVPPGSYGLIATALAPGETLKATRLAPERAGSMSLEVGNSDIEGLVVTLAPGGSIPGRIRVEGRADIDLTTFFASGTKSVGFVPWFGGGQSLIPGASLLAWAEIKPDGIFRIENVMPGEHRVDVSVLRPGMYIKEARFGLTDILAEPFRFNGRDTGNLEIVLSPNVSSLDGIVTDGRASAAPEAQVVLIPKRSRHRTDLFKTVATDQDGRFALTNLAPGEYTLYAWEAIESNRWFDPDFVSADEQYGQSIQLSESSRHSVTLRLIPARNP